ncbi:MAG: DUF1804 domain-containing protein [Bacteroidetes bacterium]|nr:DUF1804 domain-containing protein [Bacteroidota bacterium]
MAKIREKKIARILYVEQHKDAKEISRLINVSEPTLSKWVNELGWKRERNARLNSPAVRIDNIKQIINNLSEERLQLGKELKITQLEEDLEENKRLRTSIAQLDDAVSKWNKTLETINKDSQVTLTTYLAVMEMLFEALKAFDEKLYFKTLDFQEVHLNDVSLKFK